MPIYNEAECVPELFNRLNALRKEWKSVELSFLFVDDGSTDSTQDLLINLARQHSHVKLVTLSRNFGHQIALSAGLDHADGDFLVIMDADLQDPPELAMNLYREAKASGSNIVYCQRIRRHGETLLKRISAYVFYRLIVRNWEVKIPKDTGDFRLIDRKVLGALQQMNEKHRFLRGMIPWLGFQSTYVKYERSPRYAGKSKISIWKMFKFANDAIFSFSRLPAQFSFIIGAFLFAAGLSGLGFFMFWGSANLFLFGTFLFLVLMGTLFLICSLILGYLGRILEEVRDRPLYVIDDKFNLGVERQESSPTQYNLNDNSIKPTLKKPSYQPVSPD